MSNPVFERTPAFSSNPPRTPNGYPAMPGYTPQGQQGGQAAGYAAPGQYSQQAPQQYGPPADMADLERAYQAPPAAPADTGRMTYDDVIMRTGMVLGIIVLAAAVHWMVLGPNMALTFGGMLVGLVLGLVNAFKREPSPALIMAYAVAEGLFLGGISAVFGTLYEGIVSQAVIGTMSVFVVSLLLFRSGKIRVTPKFTRWLIITMAGYLVFSLVNLGLMLFGATDAPWGLRTMTVMGIPLGVILGVVAIGLAALCLIMDFDAIKRGVENGAPARYAWSAAFGIAVTLVWLYLEFLRLLAILRGD